jgi:phosphate-selective porin OprO/OprP
MKFLVSTLVVRSLYSLLLLALIPFVTYSQSYLTGYSKVQNLVLENVLLIDRSGEVEDMKVNIRIRDRILELVTQDTLEANNDELVLDAKSGVLLGDLNLGETPNFLILDADFRNNMEILLNTAAHTTFAIKNGAVVRNKLARITVPDNLNKNTREDWFSYSRPPVSLPVAYRNRNKWNRYNTKYISGAFFGALVADRQYWSSQNTSSHKQVGDLKEYNTGEIRALRFGFTGSLKFATPITYSISAATNTFDKGFDVNGDDDLSFSDWRLDIPTFNNTTVSIGKQKEPLSMERQMVLVNMPMQERTAAADALQPARNVGIVWSGNILNQDMSWAVGAFRQGLDPQYDVSFSDSASNYSSRITYVPFESKDKSTLLHLGAGVRHTDAATTLKYASEPEFNLAPAFLDTGSFEADEAYTYNLEASWRQGPLWLMGEYLYQDNKAPDLNNPGFSNFYISADYTLTGEIRGYNRRNGTFKPLDVARSVDQFGMGTWELSARLSSADFNDGLLEGGELDAYSLGVNWWLTPAFSFSVNYRYTILDRFGLEGKSSGIATRLTLLIN